LAGKICLVTGGTSGIGLAAARAFARKGAHVAAVSRRGSLTPEDPDQPLPGKSAQIVTWQADVADPVACSAAVNRVAAEFGRLDVLVHAAGCPAPGSLNDVSDEAWMHAFAVHVHAVFHLARAAAPHMARQGEGAIILLGSAAGQRGCLGALAYGVVKGALPQFARGLARELAGHRIRVNCVSPGIIRTPFQDFLTPEQAAHNVQSRIPLHREGTPDDVAALIVALVENDFITGENVSIDGGMTMRIA